MEIGYSIVIPIYGNEGSLPELLSELSSLSRSVQDQFAQRLEVVFVVDGSPDRSYEFLQLRLPEMPFASQLIRHSRNFGAFSGIRTGLTRTRGKIFAVMAADLQDPPNSILEFFNVLSSEPYDVAVGIRKKRNDPLGSLIFSGLFWGLYRRFIQPDIPKGGVDIFGCNVTFRDELLKLQEANSSLIGLIFWLGFRRKEIEYERRLRTHGKSAWTFRKKLKYLSDNLYSFSDFPIRFLRGVGAVGIIISVFFGILVLIARIQGDVPVPGYASLVLIISFFSALNLFGLGVVGSYVWRAYENTKARSFSATIDTLTFEGK